jgi:hypothetical protein
MAVVEDRGFFLTRQAIRRQLAAMPNELYLVRLIHHATRRAVPGERQWTAEQLVSPATVRFLRARNREGCDIYLCPYAGDRNAGYVLVDLDHARPGVLAEMHANGHLPCVVVQTSPGHLQAWVQLSTSRWRPLWQVPPANCWPRPTVAIGPAPIGGIWVAWLASPIRNQPGVLAPVIHRGSSSSMPVRVWRRKPTPC